MDEYSAEEIHQLMTRPDELSTFEGYVLGFMTGFIKKEDVQNLRNSFKTLREMQLNVSTCTQALNFAKILENLGYIDEYEKQTIVNYFEQIKNRIANCPDLKNFHFFYFGRLHSLYNELDIKSELNRANIRMKIKGPDKIMQDIHQRINELTQGKLPPQKNIRLLYNLTAPPLFRDKLYVKTEPKKEEIQTQNLNFKIPTPPKSFNPSDSKNPSDKAPIEKISMEIENESQSIPPILEQNQPPPPIPFKKVAKKSSKIPPKKPESPIKQNPVVQVGPLYEFINQATQNQQYIDEKTTEFVLGNLLDTFKQNNQSTLQEKPRDLVEKVIPQKNKTEPRIQESKEINTGRTTSELVRINTPEKVKPNVDVSEESKDIIPIIRNALFSGKKASTTEKNSSSKDSPFTGEMEIEKSQTKSSKIHPNQSEEEETNLHHPVDSEINYDLYDISYRSSDDFSFTSSPGDILKNQNKMVLEEPQTKELVLSYVSGSEFDEDREISFDENINVFDQKVVSCKI